MVTRTRHIKILPDAPIPSAPAHSNLCCTSESAIRPTSRVQVSSAMTATPKITYMYTIDAGNCFFQRQGSTNYRRTHQILPRKTRLSVEI
jgi:hypothetical protein